MDNLNNSKMLHAFSLPNANFKTQMNINIDADTHIKNIINCNAYLFDLTTESFSNKCIIKGKVGVKVVYVDLDNMLNAVTNTTDFSETVQSQDLTSDCQVYCYNEQLTSEYSFDDRSLKVGVNVNLKLFSTIDLNMNMSNTSTEDLIIKNHQMNVDYRLENISNSYTDNLEITLPYRVNKVLSIDLKPCLQRVECEDGYLTVEGQTIYRLICEIEGEERECLKTYCQSSPFKYQIKAEKSTPDSMAHIILKTNPNNVEFTSELNDNETTIKVDYEILAMGYLYATYEITCPDDLYSTKNELDLTFSSREFCKLSPVMNFQVAFDGEIQLGEDTNIDEIIDLTNLSTLITQTYTSKNKLTFEGVAYANLIYFNEDKDIKLLNVEFPFSVSKENNNDCDEIIDCDMTIISQKCKIKRGSTLLIDLEADVCAYTMTRKKENILEKINYKNELSYGDIAFQILIAKENETLWDFCKRAHCKKETIESTNKEIPPVFQGGEKIVIFR